MGRPAEGIDSFFPSKDDPFGFGKLENPDELKGDGSRPSGSERFIRMLRVFRLET
jgi:hypothetical protein